MDAKDLFLVCLEASPEERDTLLEGVPLELRTQVLGLLEAHDSAGAFLEPVEALQPLRSSKPERLGGFEVLEEIGRGGMGVVYRAQQREPRRDVALKVLPSHRRDSERWRRFELEAEALARLNHPSLCQIYASGVDESEGGPTAWIAMELIHGQELRAWKASEGSPSNRLDFLIALAQGIQEAHERGVIHRDLKPANILVTAAGHPKVLDFGVARLEDQCAPMTRTGEIVGTLGYMSPEQVAGQPAEVGTRSDQFALGAIAYELLVGRLPLDLDGASIPEAASIIQKAAPVAPSRLCPGLPRDLDTVLLKALSKTPAERYDSVAAFAEDLERVRSGEAIAARSPGLGRSLLRLARRHRVAAMSFVAAVLLMVSGLAWLQISNQRLSAARQRATAHAERSEERRLQAERLSERLEQTLDLANAAKDEASRTRDAATAALAEAQRDRERAVGVQAAWRSTFLKAGHFAARRESPSWAEVLEHLTSDAREAIGSPAALGARASVLVQTYLLLNRHEEALQQAERAVAAFDAEAEGGPLSDYARADLVHALRLQAQSLNMLARYEEAHSALERAATIARALRLPDNPLLLVGTLAEWSSVLMETGRKEALRERFEEAVELLPQIAPEHMGLTRPIALELGGIAWRLARPELAGELLLPVAGCAERVDLAAAEGERIGLAIGACCELAQWHAAEERLDHALHWVDRAEGLASGAALRDGMRLRLHRIAAHVLSSGERPWLALPHHAEALRLLSGPPSVALARAYCNRAATHQGYGDFASSVSDACQGISIMQRVPLALSSGGEAVLDDAWNLVAIGFHYQEEAQLAFEACERSLRYRRALFDPGSPAVADGEFSLAIYLFRLARAEEALAILRPLAARLEEADPGQTRASVLGAIASVEAWLAAHPGSAVPATRSRAAAGK